MKMRPNSTLAVMALILGLGAGPQAHAADTVALVQSLVNQGQHAKALSMADRLLAANAKEPQARFLKGIALTELDRLDEAVAVFQKLTEDFPELPEPYNNLAVLYAQQRQYDKARSALEMAIRTHPSYATAHENLGDVYARLASQAYDKALQLDSANSVAQSKLAMIHEITSGKNGARSAATPPRTAAAEKPAPVPAPTAAPVETTRAAPAATASTAPTTERASVAAAATAASTSAEPTSATASASAGQADTHTAIAFVEAWAKSWSRKDVKTYLSHYDKAFRTPGGMSRSQWEKERERRVGKPGKIEVRIENPEARIDGDTATVRFRQHYDSVGFDSTTSKTLELVRRNGTWRILDERIGG